ncbi:hypothetical protein Scep_011533 [Stephania cephalantha]|uniref:Uncharacterized protein n=1 Tax=Stephania cephalantha TaxID=152367 RepID=A0AAP0JEB6_9MAGN
MIGRANKFVLVTKHFDTGGIKRRGMVKLACEKSGTFRGMSQILGKIKATKLALKPRTEDEEENTRTQTGGTITTPPTTWTTIHLQED